MPSISIVAKMDVNEINPGEWVNIQILVINTGNMDLYDVYLSLPDIELHDVYIGFIGAGASYTYGVRTWLASDVAESIWSGPVFVSGRTSTGITVSAEQTYSVCIVHDRAVVPVRDDNPIKEEDKPAVSTLPRTGELKQRETVLILSLFVIMFAMLLLIRQRTRKE